MKTNWNKINNHEPVSCRWTEDMEEIKSLKNKLRRARAKTRLQNKILKGIKELTK